MKTMRNLRLLGSKVLLAAMALVFVAAGPALADNDDDDEARVECPCWTAKEAAATIEAALRSDRFTRKICNVDAFAEEDVDAFGAELNFRNPESNAELAYDTTWSERNGDVRLSFCQIEVQNEEGDFERLDISDLTREEVAVCTRSLGEICLFVIAPDDDDD
jgi:hypothetical protein